MKKKILFFIAIMCSFILIRAQTPGEAEIISVAGRYMNAFFPGGSRDIKSIDSLVYDDSADLFFISLDGGGWILLAGDKKLSPVLAFSYEDRYGGEEEGDNPAFNNWIDSYAAQVREVRDKKGLPVHEGWEKDYPGLKKNHDEAVNVDPLIQANWGQGSGWNRFCPVDSLGPGNHTYVGCVAVAMAQALSVYMQPDTGTGRIKYHRQDYGVIEANFFETDYNWDLMSYSAADNYNALLLYHCAVGVYMNFGPDGSSAQTSNTRYAMEDYFKMTKKSIYLSRANNEDSWVQKLTDNLLAGQPVIYRGNDDKGNPGHAFNVDGIKEGRYFHINWGWAGSRNGYFLINDFRPGSRDYSKSHAAVFNIQPYYYPVAVSLSDSVVPVGLPEGSAFARVEVVDEAHDNEYDIVLVSDSVMSGDEWIMEYYLENDSIYTGRDISQEYAGADTVRFLVNDSYENFLDVEIILTVEDTASLATAVYDNRDERLRIYPNPSSGIINIDTGGGTGPAYLRIYSSAGIRVLEIKAPQQTLTIDTGNMPRGLYIIETGYRNGRFSREKVLFF